MTDKPIDMRAPKVRALLDGRMTQHRLVLKPYPYDRSLRPGMNGYKSRPSDLWQIANDGPFFRLPYFPGDRLYVREHWRTTPAYDDLSPSEMSGEEPVKYEADGDEQMWGWPDRFVPGRFRQGMHMPRWASRLTLTVTDVRVQRLQDISEAAAVAEGIERLKGSKGPNHFTREITGKWSGSFNAPTAQEVFADLWNSLHGPDAWDANPWVVALTFTVQRGNIDQVQP